MKKSSSSAAPESNSNIEIIKTTVFEINKKLNESVIESRDSHVLLQKSLGELTEIVGQLIEIVADGYEEKI